jgi:hypothetical protein
MPIYTVTLTEPGTFVMTVHQEDERCTGARTYVDVGVSVLRHNEETGTCPRFLASRCCVVLLCPLRRK